MVVLRNESAKYGRDNIAASQLLSSLCMKHTHINVNKQSQCHMCISTVHRNYFRQPVSLPQSFLQHTTLAFSVTKRWKRQH